MHRSSRFAYEFGPFLLNAYERMLLRDGRYVPLTPKALETLVVLVEHGGRIVDKEELLKLVWPDTVVEEVSLAKNVSTLRKTLGDSEPHRYIETVPKRGYRFVAEIRVLEQPASRWRWAALAAAVFGTAALWMVLGGRLRPDPQPPAPKSTPLTSYPGRQNQVAFSPDGKQTAFSWGGAESGPPHIYVKLIGSEALLQLTRGPAADSRPAWSPDGQYITFLRSSPGRRTWYQAPALGGPERKLAEVLPYFDLGTGNSPYYSPDGKYLAIVDKSAPSEPSSIYLLSLANSERRRLTFPPAGITGDYFPAFSPDGKQLAFARAVSFSATDLYVLSLTSNRPRRLTFDGLTINGLAWTPDSRDIVFSSRRSSSLCSLWRIAASGGTPSRATTIDEEAISPAVSYSTHRLAYTRALDDMNIWRITLDAAGHATGKKTPLITSTFRDSDPDYSPDGRQIAFTSGRSGGFGIWVSGSDGANPRLLFDGGPYVTGSPRWSPDGRWIAFDSRSNDPAKAGNPSICVISADGGPVRRLTTDSAGGIAPSWSRDGKWIYFASTRSGDLEVWRMPADGGRAVQITRMGGFEAFESADGRYVYYLKGRTIPGIWRVPVGGGEEAPVVAREEAGLWRCWRVAANGIYYATAAPPEGPRLEFFDFATSSVREISRMERAPNITIPGLALAPDGRQLLYAQYDQNGSNIMMIEGFR
jgi:Tol biopolymer transport system component/DNA-binding winged helix-turn-helix (wHTH) protein